ncbi:hypothetical protein RhiJN_06760 [Ceratobasidium sp. AG-Ba]|nr:hypothetical protein RhiJN_06760 [Ceratobasidium sp. AG-Ba]QRW07674.1 hypothetical protein RhiLY_06673 [Ceratobasidium sp. AG-Ba]
MLHDHTHPATKQVFRIVEAISTQKPELILERGDSLFEKLYQRIEVYPEASRILANLASEKRVQTLFKTPSRPVQGTQSTQGTTGLDPLVKVLESSSQEHVQAGLILIQALIQKGSPHSGFDITIISRALEKPFNSGLEEIVGRALDVSVSLVLCTGPYDIDPKLIDCLKRRTLGVRDRKAILALAESEYRETIKGWAITTLVHLMENVDDVLAEGAIKVLTKFAEYGIRDLEDAVAFNVLSKVLKMAEDPTSYTYPHTFEGRVRVTQAAFEMVKACAADNGTGDDPAHGRNLIVENGIIDIVVRLTDSPSSESVDIRAAQLLVELKQYYILATGIKQSIESNGQLYGKAMMAFLAEEVRVKTLQDQVDKLWDHVADASNRSNQDSEWRRRMHQVTSRRLPGLE